MKKTLISLMLVLTLLTLCFTGCSNSEVTGDLPNAENFEGSVTSNESTVVEDSSNSEESSFEESTVSETQSTKNLEFSNFICGSIETGSSKSTDIQFDDIVSVSDFWTVPNKEQYKIIFQQDSASSYTALLLNDEMKSVEQIPSSIDNDNLTVSLHMPVGTEFTDGTSSIDFFVKVTFKVDTVHYVMELYDVETIDETSDIELGLKMDAEKSAYDIFSDILFVKKTGRLPYYHS